MNTRPRNLPALVLGLFVVMLLLVTSACSLFTPRLGNFTTTVDISLDEEMFRDSRPSFKVHNHDFWDDLDVDVDRMELHDGFVRFFGTQWQPDGSLADCTIDVRLGAENGMLTARVIALDVPGVHLTDPVVVSINQDLQAMLYLSGVDARAQVLFQDVKVTEDALQMKILVNVRF